MENGESTKKKKVELLGILKNNYAFFSTILIVSFYALCAVFSTIFLLSFGIRYSLFTSFFSVVDVALANGVVIIIAMNAMLWTGLILTVKSHRQHGKAGTSEILIVENSQENQKKAGIIKRLKRSLFAGIPYVLLILSVGLTIFSLFLPSTFADNIKEGFSERYTIETSSKKYECVSVIAGLSDYMLLWRVEVKRPIVISRSSMISAELVVDIPPHGIPMYQDRNESDEKFKARLIEYVKSRNDWSEYLYKECGQKVTWPDITDLLEEHGIKSI